MDSYQAIVSLLRNLLANDQVRLVMALITANVILGVMASLQARTFRLWRLADFLQTKVIPYLGGYLAIRIVVATMPEWGPLSDAAWAMILAALTGDVYANLRLIFPNLPAPNILIKPPDDDAEIDPARPLTAPSDAPAAGFPIQTNSAAGDQGDARFWDNPPGNTRPSGGLMA